MNATLKSGWYGSESYTYFVSKSGKTYLVQADDVDLSDGPHAVEGLPEGIEPLPSVLLDADLATAVAELD